MSKARGQPYLQADGARRSGGAGGHGVAFWAKSGRIRSAILGGLGSRRLACITVAKYWAVGG